MSTLHTNIVIRSNAATQPSASCGETATCEAGQVMSPLRTTAELQARRESRLTLTARPRSFRRARPRTPPRLPPSIDMRQSGSEAELRCMSKMMHHGHSNSRHATWRAQWTATQHSRGNTTPGARYRRNGRTQCEAQRTQQAKKQKQAGPCRCRGRRPIRAAPRTQSAAAPWRPRPRCAIKPQSESDDCSNETVQQAAIHAQQLPR